VPAAFWAAVRFAAFDGMTVLSDSSTAELGGTGITLPAARPQRVAVVSDDVRDRWRIGVDPSPSGITVSPAAPPEGGGPYEVTVNGQVFLSDNSYGVNRPVTLRDLDRGRWNRVDTDASGLFDVTLTVEAGDTVELLRNRESLAYVATLGFGVQVVDVNAFYNEDPASDPNQSDMLGVYTGYQDPTLDLCDAGGSDIGGATLDVGVLLEELPPHQIAVVGLIGLRGLIFLDSPVDDVGDLSLYGDLCLTIDGSRNVQGLEVLEDYIFDLDEDGRLEEHEARDYLLVAHRTRGVLILDATNRDYVHLVSRIELPGGAAHLGVDREARRVYAAGAGAGVYVVSVPSAVSASCLVRFWVVIRAIWAVSWVCQGCVAALSVDSRLAVPVSEVQTPVGRTSPADGFCSSLSPSLVPSTRASSSRPRARPSRRPTVAGVFGPAACCSMPRRVSARRDAGGAEDGCTKSGSGSSRLG